MDRSERFYKICNLLKSRRRVPLQVFRDALNVSRPTIYRDIEYLRDRFNAPIEYDRTGGGYRFRADENHFELPGIWLTASEAHALMTFERLLIEMQPGLLGPLVQPLQQRLEKLLNKGDASRNEVNRRIRILSLGRRNVSPNYFELISHAVLTRKRLLLGYFNRAREERTEREISPQRLVHYRDNWYLDCHDHLRNALRTFSLDSIEQVRLLERRARNVSDKMLDRELGSGFGIFAGSKTQTARLVFTPFRARWLAKEQWHPEQRGQWQDDGSYILELPYSDDRELLMDILKYGPDVAVLAPKNLRDKVSSCLRNAAKQYQE